MFLSVLFVNLKDSLIRGRSRYTHEINDCYHLCFGIRNCIVECERGFRGRSHRHHERVRHRQEDYEEEYEDYDRAAIENYGSAAISKSSHTGPRARSLAPVHNITSFAMSEGISQPNHCGLRWERKDREGSGAFGMGRIVGGIQTSIFRDFLEIEKYFYVKNQEKTRNRMNSPG